MRAEQSASMLYILCVLHMHALHAMEVSCFDASCQAASAKSSVHDVPADPSHFDTKITSYPMSATREHKTLCMRRCCRAQSALWATQQGALRLAARPYATLCMTTAAQARLTQPPSLQQRHPQEAAAHGSGCRDATCMQASRLRTHSRTCISQHLMRRSSIQVACAHAPLTMAVRVGGTGLGTGRRRGVR